MLPGPGIATPLLRQHQQLAPIELDSIACGQLAAAAGFNKAIDLDVAGLNALLGLATGGHQALVLEKLIELHRGAAAAMAMEP